MNEQQVFDDLTTTNDLGDGQYEYFVRDGRLYCNEYGEGSDVVATWGIDVAVIEVMQP